MKIKVLNLPNGDKRIISGNLLEQFDLDYTQALDKLKRDIQFALSVLSRKKSIENQNIRVIQSEHHLDIVDEHNQSLDWLTVEDQWHGFFSILSELTDEDKKDLDEIFPLKQSDNSSNIEKHHA